YNEEGNLWKEELLKAKPGWWLYVRDFPYQGITLVLENDSSRGESAPLVCTIKNKRGDELFSFTWGLDFQTGAGVMFLPDGNGIFRSRYSSNSRDCYAELLSWDGTLIGQIDNLCEITIDSKATPDKKFMILYDGSTAVIVKNGKEVCRKKFVLNLSDDGKFICFGDTLKMHTYHVGTLENGGLLYTFLFAPSNTGMINCAFSSNNKYLAAFSPSELILIDNETGKQLWKRKVDGDAYKRKVFFANNDKHIVLAYLGRVYIFDLGGNLLKTINEPNSNNWQVYNDILIIDIRDDHILHKVIYKSK
ncbi:MAG: hypothetical protein ACUVQT_08235, partial [bacterium]